MRYIATAESTSVERQILFYASVRASKYWESAHAVP
jgi:hypothetical protein